MGGDVVIKFLDLPHGPVEESEAHRYPVANLRSCSKGGGMEQTNLWLFRAFPAVKIRNHTGLGLAVEVEFLLLA